MKSTKKLIWGIEDFNGHVGKKVDGFEGVHGENEIGEWNLKGRMLLEFCNQKIFGFCWYKNFKIAHKTKFQMKHLGLKAILKYLFVWGLKAILKYLFVCILKVT